MTASGFNFKEWYETHGETLNKRRRKRYDDDPEYRTRVLEMNRRSRERRRKEKEAELAVEREAKKLRQRLSPWKTVEVGGNQLRTIGALAAALGVSVQAVRLWEKQKILPPAPMRNRKGDRLYPPDYLDLAREILVKQGRLDAEKLAQLKETPETKAFLATVQHKGKKFDLVLFRIGMLARALQRTVVTMEQMEQRGALPETPFRATTTGYRLYSREMIEDVRKAMDARGGTIRGEDRWLDFHQEVEKAWTKLGVFGMKLLKLRPLPDEQS